MPGHARPSAAREPGGRLAGQTAERGRGQQSVARHVAGAAGPRDAACGTTAEPFLNACDYDGAGALLAHLYGPLAKPAKAAAPRAFDQRRYDVDGALAPQGWVYVPAACARGERCRLHVAFHGCRQGEDFVGATFVNHAGYNRWAEANRIVVLYPQVRKSLLLPLNPQGCWDWWGYAGADYATRDGAQVRAVRAMVRALAGL